MLCKGNKEAGAENLNQGFWERVCVCIHRPTYTGQLNAYAYFEPAYACRHALKNPNPKNKNIETEQK